MEVGDSKWSMCNILCRLPGIILRTAVLPSHQVLELMIVEAAIDDLLDLVFDLVIDHLRLRRWRTNTATDRIWKGRVELDHRENRMKAAHGRREFKTIRTAANFAFHDIRSQPLVR